MSLTVTVDAKETIKALEKINRRYKTAVVREAAKMAGDVLLERAKELAPEETGTLKLSLDKQVIVRRGSAEVRVGPKANFVELVTVPPRRTPESRAPSFESPPDINHRGYEVYEEYGTEHSPAHSFIRRSLDERGDRAIELAAHILDQGLAQDV